MSWSPLRRDYRPSIGLNCLETLSLFLTSSPCPSLGQSHSPNTLKVTSRHDPSKVVTPRQHMTWLCKTIHVTALLWSNYTLLTPLDYFLQKPVSQFACVLFFSIYFLRFQSTFRTFTEYFTKSHEHLTDNMKHREDVIYKVTVMSIFVCYGAHYIFTCFSVL